MKIKTIEEQKFTPITITLETQEEVDKLYTLANHAYIDRAIGLHELYLGLQPYRNSQNSVKYHTRLISILKESNG